MKAVFHVDELEKWGLALTNVSNMAAYYEKAKKPCALEIVANGVAVKALTTDSGLGIAGRLEEAACKSVVIAACQNALATQKISPNNLLPFITIVPAGVVELAEKQKEGYAYIKP